jgi:hypothetical protein
VAATAAFRRLVAPAPASQRRREHIDLMGLAGFCRNCLGDWMMRKQNLAIQNQAATSETGRAIVHGMPTARMESAPSYRRDRRTARPDGRKHGQKSRHALGTRQRDSDSYLPEI